MTKKTIELFDCLVRHGGNKDHEIPKYGISATEIRLLRAMHGDEAVMDRDIKEHVVNGKHATREVDDKIELFELARRYANTADPLSAKKLIERAFGTTLIGFDKWVSEVTERENREQEEAMLARQRDATRQAHVAAAAASAAAAATLAPSKAAAA